MESHSLRLRPRRRSEIRGMRLWDEATDALDQEVERTGEYPAVLVSELILQHFPRPEAPRQPRKPSAVRERLIAK